MNLISKIQEKINSRRVMVTLSFVGLYLLSSGISLVAFSYLKGDPQFVNISGSLDEVRSKLSLDLPRTEECPINGKKFTTIEKNIWESRRPITAVIENHLDSRPQSGLSKADVIYEYVAEGGITRFLGVFYCGSAASDVRIGPIRSARTYGIHLAGEYGDAPLFVHSGGANNICRTCPRGEKPRGDVAKEVDAFSLLAELGWRYANGNALDAGTNAGFPEVWRDYERIPGVATEHTYMGSTDKLYTLGEERGFGFKNADGEPWNKSFKAFRFANNVENGGNTKKISFEFWSNKGDYDVVWEYEAGSNQYLRSTGGKRHTDLDNKEQLRTNNVVIQLTKEEGPVDRESHMFYEVIGRGKALIFQNGNAIEGSWEKSSLPARTRFYDKSGAEISFVRGPIWIEIVPDGNTIDY